MAKKPPKFYEDLATPIVKMDLGHLTLLSCGTSEETQKRIWKEAENWVLREKERKLILLARCFRVSINERNWERTLLLRLAETHVKGFSVVDRPPRTAGRSRMDYLPMIEDIDSMRKTVKSVARACEILSKKDGPWKGRNPESMATRYYEFMRQERDQNAPKRREWPGFPNYGRIMEIRQKDPLLRKTFKGFL